MASIPRPARVLVCLLALVAAGLPCQPARAAAPPAETATATPAAPETIPLSEVVDRAEQADAELSKLAQVAADQPRLDALEEFLANSRSVIEELEANLDRAVETGSTDKLEPLRQQAIGLQEELGRRSGPLRDRIAAITRAQERRLELDELWQATEHSLKQGEGLEAVLSRTREVLAHIAEVRKRLGKQAQVALSLQTGVAERRQALSQVLAGIEDQVGPRHSLLEPDAVPFWQAAPAEDLSAVSKDLRSGLDAALEAVGLFVERNRARLEVHAALLLLLLVMALVLSRLRRERAADTDWRPLLQRPISFTLVVSLAWMRLLYPDAPEDVYKVVWVLLLVPLLRLLWLLFGERGRHALSLLTGLIVLEQLGQLAPTGSVANRLALVLLALAAIGAAIWWLRSFARSVLDRWVGRLMLAANLSSLVANTTGRVGLAEVLCWGSVDSILAVMAGWVLVRLLMSVARMLMSSRLGRSLRSLDRGRPQFERGLQLLLTLMVGLAITRAVLARFQLLEPLIDWLSALLSLGVDQGSLALSLGDVFAFLLVLLISVVVARVAAWVLQYEVLERLPLPRGVPASAARLSSYLLLALGLVAAVAAAGVDLGKLTLLGSALGVGIGFGLQNVVSNFVSGLILLAERPIHVGDVVQIGPLLGSVKSIGIRATMLRTFDGSDVSVPNGKLISDNLTNWTLSDHTRRVSLRLRVTFGADPHRVLELLREAARHEDVRPQPEPLALFKGFGENGLEFELLYWLREGANLFLLESAVALAVHDLLREAGIEVAVPVREVRTQASRQDAPGESGSQGPAS